MPKSATKKVSATRALRRLEPRSTKNWPKILLEMWTKNGFSRSLIKTFFVRGNRPRIHPCQGRTDCAACASLREIYLVRKREGNCTLNLDEYRGQPDFSGAHRAVERVHHDWIEFRPCKR